RLWAWLLVWARATTGAQSRSLQRRGGAARLGLLGLHRGEPSVTSPCLAARTPSWGAGPNCQRARYGDVAVEIRDHAHPIARHSHWHCAFIHADRRGG